MKTTKQRTATDLAILLEDFKDKKNHFDKLWNEQHDKEVLRLFVDIIPRVVDAERCGIFIDDPLNDTVWLSQGTGSQEKAVVLPVEGSNVGTVIATGKPVTVNNPEERSRIGRSLDNTTGYPHKTMIAVPIHDISHLKCIGAIQVLNKKNDGTFTREDQELLERIARHLSIMVEQIFLNQKVVGEIMQYSKKRDLIRWGRHAPRPADLIRLGL